MRANARFRRQDSAGGASDNAKAIKLNSKNSTYLAEALNLRYHSYIAEQDWKKALPSCLECLKVEPTRDVAHDASLICKKMNDYPGFVKYGKLASICCQSRFQKISTLSQTLK